MFASPKLPLLVGLRSVCNEILRYKTSMENPLCQYILKKKIREAASTQVIKVFIAQNGGHPHDRRFLLFKIDHDIRYHPYCDDFGPMNMECTVRFIEKLDAEMVACARASCRQLVLSVDRGQRRLTNALMLLGCYLILKQDMTPDQVADRFSTILPEQLEDFRDATHLPADFGLTLRDCWGGVYRGKECGWIARPAHADSPLWGAIDIEEYAHYDNPCNADLHQLVPGRLIAFRGPHDLGGALYADDAASGIRRFSPAFYADVLSELGVSDVVQLNEEEYDAQAFAAAGIRHHRLVFEDCTEPPGPLVAAFLAIVGAARGAVAVHCKAGLGRTGTLIAVWMMKAHGFTARTAMGWLRVMRPGSVIGRQQHFLCLVQRIRDAQAAARRTGLALPRAASSPSLRGGSNGPPAQLPIGRDTSSTRTPCKNRESARISAIFINSDGCSCNGPMSIQRSAPLPMRRGAAAPYLRWSLRT